MKQGIATRTPIARPRATMPGERSVTTCSPLFQVPSMAIENVRIFQNTSIIQDEVLAHRLGLVPLQVDPRLFDYVEDNDGVPNQKNTLVFTLDIACTRNAKAPASAEASEKFVNATIYSRDFKWIPQGQQVPPFTRAHTHTLTHTHAHRHMHCPVSLCRFV